MTNSAIELLDFAIGTGKFTTDTNDVIADITGAAAEYNENDLVGLSTSLLVATLSIVELLNKFPNQTPYLSVVADALVVADSLQGDKNNESINGISTDTALLAASLFTSLLSTSALGLAVGATSLTAAAPIIAIGIAVGTVGAGLSIWASQPSNSTLIESETIINGLASLGLGLARHIETVDEVLMGDELSFLGGDSREEVIGGDYDNIIDTLGGDDFLFGGQGADVLLAGAGSDFLYGDEGNDQLTGGPDTDYLEGGEGADLFFWNTGDGDDVIGDFDDAGDRIIVNGADLATFQFMRVSAGSPFYVDPSNPDITLRYDGSVLEISINGGADSGTITATQYSPATGADYGIVLTDFEADVPVGTDVSVQTLGTSNDGNEIDTSAYWRQQSGQGGYDWSNIAIRFDASAVSNYSGGSLHGTFGGAFEGGPVNDHLSGDVDSNALHGLGGQDRLEGGAGSDFLEGGAGSDMLSGGDGGDILFGSARAGLVDELDPGSQHDQFYLSEITDIAGDINNLDGGTGDDYVSGGEFTDYIDGGAGADYLLGGTGQDYIHGGDDQDIIYGDSSLHYRYVELTPGVASEQLEIAFADGADAVGRYDDVIIAGGGNDIVWGELGDDDLYGAEGDDTLYGDRISDATYFSAELPAYLSTSPGLDTALHGDDRLYGGAGSDLLVGHGGNDFLSGGADTDHLMGGEGDDTYYFQPGDGLDHIQDDAGIHTLLFTGVALADLQILFQGDQVFVGTDSGQQGFQISKDEWPDIQIALGSASAKVERSRIDSHYLDSDGNVLISVSGSDVGTEADRELLFEMDNSTAGSPVVMFNSGAERAELESLPDGRARMNVIGDSLAFVVEMGSLQLQTGLEFLHLTESMSLQLQGFAGDITGSSWNDIIEGSAGDDRISAGAGNDIISGNGGADELDGGAGSDQLRGGTGNDSLAGGYGSDVYQFAEGDGLDTISDASGSHAFEFDASVDPSAVVMYWTGDTDSDFRMEYSQFDAVGSNGSTSAYWISRVTVGGIEIPLIQRSDLSEGHFQDTRYNDVFEGGSGNDTFLTQGWGNDVYRFAAGDGQDVIHVGTQLTPSYMGEIRFDASVDLSSLEFSFQSGDAFIRYGGSD
ncbi:MAG: calcium-binding protein, partial [Halioglobus sp.]